MIHSTLVRPVGPKFLRSHRESRFHHGGRRQAGRGRQQATGNKKCCYNIHPVPSKLLISLGLRRTNVECLDLLFDAMVMVIAEATSASTQKEVVSETLTQLASHFNQAVHEVEEKPPYFDSFWGGTPPEESSSSSPVVRFYIDRLGSLPSSAIFYWIIGYITTVRKLLRTPGNNALPVLQNYELILSNWLDQVRCIQSDEPIITIENREAISKTAALVSSDLLFAFNDSSLSFSEYIRGNVLIPTLLRIQYQIFRALPLSRERLEGSEEKDFVSCCLSLLPFLRTRLDPPSIDPDLVDTRGENGFQSPCAIPPRPSELALNYDDFLSLKAVSWADVTLDGSSTLFTGIACRVAAQVWESLAALLQSSHATTDLPRENDNDRDSIHGVVTNDDCGMALRALGIVQVAEAVRSRFFGLDVLEHFSSEAQSQTQVFLGRRIVKKSKPMEDIVYKSNPSVVHILLNFVRLVGYQDRKQTSELVCQIIPCCLELLDSTTTTHVALGASALTHLLKVLDQEDKAWRNMKDNILSMLKDASKVHRKGPAVLSIGRAQHLILQQSRDSGRIQASFCKEWFLTLHQTAVRSRSDASWEIIVGPLIPLLHGMTTSSDAPGVEIGRLGLSALLPLIAGEFVDLRTQIAAMVALNNLMVAAHPIMPHHGGKIICHLLASHSRPLADDTKDVQCLRGMMGHTAAVCLVVCGTSAYAVIDAIESEINKYQKPFLEVVAQVRSLAITLQMDSRGLASV